MSALPEPTSQAREPDTEPTEDMWSMSVTPEQVLDYVRDQATRRDWRHAELYQAVDAARVKDSIEVLRTILAVHLEFHRRTGRKARTGRRQHQAAIRDAIAATNEATFILGLAWLDAAYGLLPPSRPPQND